MSTIKDYLHELEKLIHDALCKLFADFQIENRGDVALYLRGKIIFTNESELQFQRILCYYPDNGKKWLILIIAKIETKNSSSDTTMQSITKK